MALADINKESGSRLDAAARKNSQATPSEPKPDVVEKIVVIFQNEEYILRTDGGDLDARNKLTGHGFTITQQGDFIFVSGPGGKGNPCGGRFMINTTGGQITKNDGPNIEENTASSTSAVTEQNESNGSKPGLAKSVMCNGDHLEECHGTRRIDGTHVVITASEKLTLTGLNGIVLQAGPKGDGELIMNAGTIKQVTGTMETTITGQKTESNSESSTTQLDPRSTTAIVSSGHLSQQFLGDLKQVITGQYEVQVLGKVSVPPSGFITSPTSGINMYTLNGDMKFSTANPKSSIFATAGIEKPSLVVEPGSISLQATSSVEIKALVKDIVLDALQKITADAKQEVKITGKGVEIAGGEGDVKVTGAKIYLN